ncbi:cob(I)yrinic acid a,c-diamide adenosyltransferase [Thermoactinomyces sp. AMNI-1]|uniref:Corrinoid adenosyltransferase n=1 Tax=Thermoactinomyces mirandus TaxID=2756294 RepID=A0A7W1XU49_9BACL|nr:cob(I)yrinic acid a,c-diamide adenosyltransferase [Thermoactinomyces mirandus]
MAIYTKKGDQGETGLLGGSRVGKDSVKVSCYGTLDEANASLGIAYSLLKNDQLKERLRKIQKQLFVVGSELASDSKGKDLLENRIQSSDIADLEQTIDTLEKYLGPLHEFVIPGETPASAALHQARAIIRRAERHMVKLDKTEPVRDELKKYMNRLSDAIFMLARAEVRSSFADKVKSRVMQKLEQSEKNRSTGLHLDTAKKMAEAAETYANEIGVPITFSAVDEHGNLILVHRMEGSLLASLDISQNKAYSSLALKMPTHEISRQAQPGKDLYGIANANRNRIVTFGGGYPIRQNGKVIGGIGISGGTVAEDMWIAEKVVKKFEAGLR